MNARTFFYQFGKAFYHIDSIYDDFAKQGKVSPAMLWVLYALNDGEQHTQVEISTVWELPKTTVNTVVKELEQRACVELVPIKGKRREMAIELTDSGKDYAEKVLSELYEKEAFVFQKLDSTERGVIEVLEKIAEGMKGEH